MRQALVLAVLLALPAAGCAPPRPGYRIQAGGVTMDGEMMRAVVSVQARSAYADDQVFVVSCPRSVAGGVQPDQCHWQPLGEPGTAPVGAAPVAPPSGRGPRAGEAMEMASASHGCPRDGVAIQSDASRDGVEGYWMDVCGRQRFMQWDESQGHFVDRTPAE